MVLALPRERRAACSAGRAGLIGIGRRHPHLSLLLLTNLVYLIYMVPNHSFKKERIGQGFCFSRLQRALAQPSPTPPVASPKSHTAALLMSRTDGGTNDAELESSEESRFSDAAPRPPSNHSKRKRKKDKKRAGNGSAFDQDFDDHDFVFREHGMDAGTRRDDGGGSLGAGLQDSLNAMASPGIGGRPMKKKSGQQKHRASGGGERSRSASAGRAQARGTRTHHRIPRTGPSSFLDQADEERTRDVGVTSGGSPARHEPAPRAKSNKSGGKVHRGPAWTSTQGNDEPSLELGAFGTIRRPSTQTRRSRDKRAMKQSGNRQQQWEEKDPIDMTDDHEGGAVYDGLPNKSPPPRVQAAKNDDELYGVSGTFQESDTMAPKNDGVDWDLKSDEDRNSDDVAPSSDSEDFAKVRNVKTSNRRRMTKSEISKRKYNGEPIEVNDDENSGSQSSGRSFFDSCKSAAKSITGSATKLWWESGSGSKRGKDKQGGSGKRTTLLRRYDV